MQFWMSVIVGLGHMSVTSLKLFVSTDLYSGVPPYPVFSQLFKITPIGRNFHFAHNGWQWKWWSARGTCILSWDPNSDGDL